MRPRSISPSPSSAAPQSHARRAPAAAIALSCALSALAWSADRGDFESSGVLPYDRLAQSEPATERPDLLTFAAGALPIRVGGSATTIGTDFEQAIEVVDGSHVAQTLNLQHAGPDTDFEFLYELPAETTFDRLAVPEIGEVPSPSTSFVGHVEIAGSNVGPDGPFDVLADAALPAHDRRGQVTELPILASPAVRWVRVRFTGSNEAGAVFLQFTELIGNGTQSASPASSAFHGLWDARGGLLELHQDGPVVSGCADDGQRSVAGNVIGNLLFATTTDNSTGIPGALVLSIDSTGGVWGLRSDNGAPFTMMTGPVAPTGTPAPCSAAPTPSLGCDSILHGVRFAFDSARLLPESTPVLGALRDGIAGIDGRVTIEGHTSSEGSDDYNRDLSLRRARAVVEILIGLGVDASRLDAVGFGEERPIARNDDETGRALNRRVEVRCVDAP